MIAWVEVTVLVEMEVGVELGTGVVAGMEVMALVLQQLVRAVTRQTVLMVVVFVLGATVVHMVRVLEVAVVAGQLRMTRVGQPAVEGLVGMVVLGFFQR